MFIIAIIVCGVCCFGCVSGDNQIQTPAQPTQNYTIICCPNPDCVLHDPNSHSSDYGSTARPIIVNTYVTRGSEVHHTYLCQMCGAEWSD